MIEGPHLGQSEHSSTVKYGLSLIIGIFLDQSKNSNCSIPLRETRMKCAMQLKPILWVGFVGLSDYFNTRNLLPYVMQYNDFEFHLETATPTSKIELRKDI